MTRTKSNSISFEQILEELKSQRPNIKDVYFDNHHGFWTISYDTYSEEFETFQDLLNDFPTKDMIVK